MKGMTLLKVLSWIVAIPVGWVWKAFVAVYLWSWFIVPLGVPAVGMTHALGLTLAGWYFCGGMTGVTRDKSVGFTEWIAVQLAIGITGLFGCLFHSFM